MPGIRPAVTEVSGNGEDGQWCGEMLSPTYNKGAYEHFPCTATLAPGTSGQLLHLMQSLLETLKVSAGQKMTH